VLFSGRSIDPDVTIGVSLLAGVAFGLAMAAPPGPMNAVIAEESVLRGFPAGVRAGLGAMTGDAIFCVLALVGVVEIVDHAPTLRAGMVGLGGVLMCLFAVDAARNVSAPSASTAGTEGDAGRQKRGGEADGDDDRSAVDADVWERDASDRDAPDQTFANRDTPVRAASADTDEGATADAPENRLGRSTGFQKALALSLTNPYQIVFWLTVGVGLLRPGTLDLGAEAPWLADATDAVGIGGSLVVETGSVALLAGFFGGIGIWITSYPATVAAIGRRSDRASAGIAALSAIVLAGFGVVFILDAATAFW